MLKVTSLHFIVKMFIFKLSLKFLPQNLETVPTALISFNAWTDWNDMFESPETNVN